MGVGVLVSALLQLQKFGLVQVQAYRLCRELVGIFLLQNRSPCRGVQTLQESSFILKSEVFILHTIFSVFILHTIIAVFILHAIISVFILHVIISVFILHTIISVFILHTIISVFILHTIISVFILHTIISVFILHVIISVFIRHTIISVFILHTIIAVFILHVIIAVFILHAIISVFILHVIISVFILHIIIAVFILHVITSVFILHTIISAFFLHTIIQNRYFTVFIAKAYIDINHTGTGYRLWSTPSFTDQYVPTLALLVAALSNWKKVSSLSVSARLCLIGITSLYNNINFTHPLRGLSCSVSQIIFTITFFPPFSLIQFKFSKQHLVMYESLMLINLS